MEPQRPPDNSAFSGQDAQRDPPPLDMSLSCSVAKDVGRLLRTEEDFTVIVDGSDIRCSSLVLRACSEYFRSLLATDMIEKAKASVELPGISKATFEAIYSMMTSGQSTLTKANVGQVWMTADRLQFQSVVKLCETFLVTFLSTDVTYTPSDDPLNTYSHEDMYRLAVALNSQKVIDACLRVLMRNIEQFRLTSDFKNLRFEDVLALVESDDLTVDKEFKVVEAVFAWVGYTPVQMKRSGLNSGNLNMPGRAECLSTNEPTENESQLKENEELYLGENADATNLEEIDSTPPNTKAGHENCRTNDGGIQNIPEQEGETAKKVDAERNVTTIEQSRSDNNNHCVTGDGQIVQKPNPKRLPYLADLLAACRLCELGRKCLNACLDLAIAWWDKEAVRVLRQAIHFFFFTKEWIGWPIFYRKCSQYRNIIVCQSEKALFYYDCQSGNMCRLTDQLTANDSLVHMTNACSHDIVVAGPEEGCSKSERLQHDCNISIIKLIKNPTPAVIPDNPFQIDQIPMPRSSLLKKGNVLTRVRENVFHYNITYSWYWGFEEERNMIVWIDFDNAPRRLDYKHVLNDSSGHWSFRNQRGQSKGYAHYDDTLLRVSEDTDNDITITCVTCLCMKTGRSYNLNPIEGPGKDFVVFGDGPTAYFLQANGALWKIGRKKDPNTTFDLGNDFGSEGDLDLLFQTRMWEEVIHLCGAVVYKDTLILFVFFDSQSMSRPVIDATGFFEKTKIVPLSKKVKCRPYVLPRDMLSG